LPDSILASDGLKDYVMKVYRASVPLNKFILKATS